MNKNEKGFGVVEALLAFLVLAVSGYAGYYVWQTNHEAKPVVTSIEPIRTITNDAKQTESAIPYKCGSQEAINDTNSHPDSLDFKYTSPKDWKLNSDLNADTLKSPDLAYEGRKITYGDGEGNGISTGANLIISVDSYCTWGEGTEADLRKLGDRDDNGLVGEFIKVAGSPGVKDSRINSGTVYDNLQSITFVKDGYVYNIELQYAYSKENPYPKVVDDIVNSIKF